MKLFVAINTMNGPRKGGRKNDFYHAETGDILTFALECDRDRGNIDGTCGCRRAMRSISNGKSTTTFTVVDRHDMTKSKLANCLTIYYRNNGWTADIITDAEIRQEAEELAELAEAFTEGVTLEKRGNRIQERRTAAKAAL